jgi:hypothetical protein
VLNQQVGQLEDDFIAGPKRHSRRLESATSASRGRKLGAQQLGVELRHSPAILAVAILQEVPEGEILQKHAHLRGGKIHAVIDVLAPADGTHQPVDRPAIEAQRHQMPEPALTSCAACHAIQLTKKTMCRVLIAEKIPMRIRSNFHDASRSLRGYQLAAARRD